MGRKKYPVTAAIRTLRQAKVEFEVRQYPYEDHGGAVHAARCLALPPHQVVKTLVTEDDEEADAETTCKEDLGDIVTLLKGGNKELPEPCR